MSAVIVICICWHEAFRHLERVQSIIFGFGRPTDTAYVLLLMKRATTVVTGSQQRQRYGLVSSHTPGASRESERRSARREFANPCLLQQSDGVARRGSGFASGLDVCCHLSAMPLVLVCLLERLVATENDWGPNDGCALTPCSTCGEGLRYRW